VIGWIEFCKLADPGKIFTGAHRKIVHYANEITSLGNEVFDEIGSYKSAATGN